MPGAGRAAVGGALRRDEDTTGEGRGVGAGWPTGADVAAAAYVRAPRAEVRALLARRELWAWCWPGLHLEVAEDRGLKGVRWTVEGALPGTAEVWLEPWRETCVAHVYLRPEPPARTASRRVSRRQRRVVAAYGERTRALLFWAKDRLEQR